MSRTAESPAVRVEEFRNLIGGEWTASVARRTFDDVNPADTRDIVGRFQASTAADARAVHDDRAHSDQRIVFKRATMQDHIVAGGAVRADRERKELAHGRGGWHTQSKEGQVSLSDLVLAVFLGGMLQSVAVTGVNYALRKYYVRRAVKKFEASLLELFKRPYPAVPEPAPHTEGLN